jgi:hypothetical protein
MPTSGTGRIRRPFPGGDSLPGFPDAQKLRAKTPRPGGGLRSRWKTADGRIVERDRLHDTAEVKPARSDALRGALTVMYRVVTYDRTTEAMKGSLVVPPSVVSKVKRIARFQPQEDGLGEYPLDERQTRQVAKTLGFKPEPDRFYYYVEPFEPAEDSGLQS